MDGRAGSAAGVLLLRLRVVTRFAEVLEVCRVLLGTAATERDDVVDLFARHGQALCRA